MVFKQDNEIKVLIVSHHFPPEKTANASRIYEMALNLNRLGLQTIVFSPYPTYPAFKRTWEFWRWKELNGIKVLNLWTWQPKSRDAGFLSRILYYLLFPLNAILWTLRYSKDFDVIITSNPPIFTGIPGLFSKIILNKYWIIDTRDQWVNVAISLGFLRSGSLFEKMSNFYEKICYSRADLVLAVTNKLADQITERYKIDKKIRLIPNSVDIDLFYPYKNIEKKNQIVFIGNMGHVMGLENCIIAMEKVLKSHNIKFILFGDGDKREKLEKLVKSIGLNEFIIFKGLVKRELLPKILSESLIGLAPTLEMKTLDYVIPVKLYEYMACGVPFIACGLKETKNLAKESKGGIVVKNSPEAIAKSILALLEDPIKSLEMGRNGRKFVQKYCNRMDITNYLKEYIEEMSIHYK